MWRSTIIDKKNNHQKALNGHSTGIVQFIALDSTEQVFALDRDLEEIDLPLVASIWLPHFKPKKPK